LTKIRIISITMMTIVENTRSQVTQPDTFSNNIPQNHGGYGSTLFDPRWKGRKKQIEERDQHKCMNCGSTDQLQVHHRQYHFSQNLKVFRNPWEYADRYLITLCEKCHQKGHRTFKVPVKFIK
jgi:hypothetical protein